VGRQEYCVLRREDSVGRQGAMKYVCKGLQVDIWGKGDSMFSQRRGAGGAAVGEWGTRVPPSLYAQTVGRQTEGLSGRETSS